MIEQRPARFRRCGQLLQEVRQQRNVKAIDLRQSRDLVGVVAMVAQRVVRIANANFGVAAVRRLTGELKGHHPGHVALHGQHLQVEHQLGVFFVRCGNTQRPFKVALFALVHVRLGLVDPPFHFAHRLQVLIDLPAVGSANFAFQAADFVRQRVEQTCLTTQRRPPLLGTTPFAEHGLEDDPRVGLRRQRSRWRRPRQVVLIHAGVAVVALTNHLGQIHGQLQRRQFSLLADVLRGDLIRRDAEVVVGRFGMLRASAAQERRVAGRVRSRIRLGEFQIADHVQLVAHGSKRLENIWQFAQRFVGRRPARMIAAHWHVNVLQPFDGLGNGRLRRCRPGGQHGVEQRQGDRRARAPQHGAP